MVMPGSGAEAAEIVAGDHLLGVDGISVTEPASTARSRTFAARRDDRRARGAARRQVRALTSSAAAQGVITRLRRIEHAAHEQDAAGHAVVEQRTRTSGRARRAAAAARPCRRRCRCRRQPPRRHASRRSIVAVVDHGLDVEVVIAVDAGEVAVSGRNASWITEAVEQRIKALVLGDRENFGSVTSSGSPAGCAAAIAWVSASPENWLRIAGRPGTSGTITTSEMSLPRNGSTPRSAFAEPTECDGQARVHQGGRARSAPPATWKLDGHRLHRVELGVPVAPLNTIAFASTRQSRRIESSGPNSSGCRRRSGSRPTG